MGDGSAMLLDGNSEMRNGGAEKRAAASDRGAPGRSAWLQAGPTLRPRRLGTPPRRITRSAIRDGGGGEASLKNSKISCTSCGTANFSRWGRSIRKNIIGHRMRHRTCHRTCHGTWHGGGRGMAVRGKQTFARGEFRRAGRPFPLLDQPAREHGAGVLFHPLIQQGANLLPEIGGMAKTREFITLERIPRRREKKLPRGLRWGTGHVGLLRRMRCRVTNQ
jgi:hypothetical protein